jgi:hypothetical protein
MSAGLWLILARMPFPSPDGPPEPLSLGEWAFAALFGLLTVCSIALSIIT